MGGGGRELFEHSPGQQESRWRSCLFLGIKPVRYLRRHIGDSDDGQVDLVECWDEEWEDEAPVDAENAAKCNEFRRAKRARLAVAAQASKRALAARQ